MFQFGQDGSASAMSQRAVDLFDDRPVRTVLIVGNSRTFYHDMPEMLRALAKSPDSKINLQVETSTAPGETFEGHWSRGRTKRLLSEGWDEILLQGESAAQSSLEQNKSFQKYGVKLAGIAKLNDGRPTLLVNWPYEPSIFEGYGPYDRAEHLEFLRKIHATLASKAEMDRLNLAGVWESVRRANPTLELTTDGNHPTKAASYLYALAVYAHVTNSPVGPLTYVPEGIDPAIAAKMRSAVDSYPLSLS